LDGNEIKRLELMIASWKNIHRNYYRNKPYIQITGEDVIYLEKIQDLENLIQDYKRIKGKEEN
jgi:hypothetical protein